MEKLRRLDIAQGYVELLAEVDKLRYKSAMVLRYWAVNNIDP